jgi:DNA-directed RNA polymerase
MTDTLVQRQWELERSLERSAKAEAVKRLKERTKRAEDKNYASSTVYGTAFIKNGLDQASSCIAGKLVHLTRGPGQGRAAAGQYVADMNFVKHMDPYVLALITAKKVLDIQHVQVPRNTYQVLCNTIGRCVYDEYLLELFEEKHPKEFGWTQKDQRGKNKGYAYAMSDFRARMRKVAMEIPKWPAGTKHKVGAWLLDRLAESTGWITSRDYVSGPKGARNTPKLVFPTPEFLEAKQALMEQAERLAWCQWPMVCEPLPWSDSRRGGYLTAELRSMTKLIRSRRPGGPMCALSPDLDGTPALDMLNNLQRVPYRINRVVYEVARECQERGVSIGKFSQERPIDPPVKPDWETASEEAKKEYRIARTQIEDHNYSIANKNYRSDECMYVARKVLDSVFWIPWSFDYRGRVYPLVTSLSPQGTDFEKALIRCHAAEPGPINEYWLAFQVATTYGLDKASMDERQQWVKGNLDLISRIANDPFTHRSEWSDVEEPWCFLASCVEYNDCVIEKTKTSSTLLISVDATCSGLQHLSALTLDRSAAELVNVVPTPKPTDAYKVVANKAKDHLPESVHHLLTRKVAKRTVMTVPYGVSLISARDYIRQELPKELPEGVTLSDVVKAIYQKAIPEVIPGPIRAMGYIQRSVSEVVKASGQTFISWVTPSGFRVVQDLRAEKTERINTKLLGSRILTNLRVELNEPDVAHHKGASAPNLIHSLDASLLHLVFAKETRPFSVIHDCILMRSCDMDYINQRIRDVFVDIYSTLFLKGKPKPNGTLFLRDWAAQIGAPFDESVMINTLDIQDARNSPHLFC